MLIAFLGSVYHIKNDNQRRPPQPAAPSRMGNPAEARAFLRGLRLAPVKNFLDVIVEEVRIFEKLETSDRPRSL